MLIAAQEDAAGNLGNSARRALLSVGAGASEVAALGTHRRSSFAMIGRKGAKPGSVPQVRGVAGCVFFDMSQGSLLQCAE